VTPKKSNVPSGINSIEDILSPFDKFPNYYLKVGDPKPRGGSDMSEATPLSVSCLGSFDLLTNSL
jgi:hypothetical protein